MKRVEVFEFIKSGVDRLQKQHGFARGRLSEFSSRVNVTYPYVWLETSEMNSELSNNSLPIDTWAIRLFIGKLDREDSSAEDYEALIDQCDEVAQTLIFLYNDIVSDSNLLRIENTVRTPFVKTLANSVTGVALSFNLIGPDTTPQDCE